MAKLFTVGAKDLFEANMPGYFKSLDGKSATDIYSVWTVPQLVLTKLLTQLHDYPCEKCFLFQDEVSNVFQKSYRKFSLETLDAIPKSDNNKKYIIYKDFENKPEDLNSQDLEHFNAIFVSLVHWRLFQDGGLRLWPQIAWKKKVDDNHSSINDHILTTGLSNNCLHGQNIINI